MESEFDTKGLITKASHDSCIVSVAINDVPKSFSFSKCLLYAFGLQCEGQMTNLLDEGMEVDVRYKFANDKRPYIIAVWLFEKPSYLNKEAKSLKSCYDQTGHIIGVRNDNVVVQNDLNQTVLINNEVFFWNGYRTKNIYGMVEGEQVSYDAIPFETEHPAETSYQATCAWVGSAPTMLERFELHSSASFDDPLDIEDRMDLVYGTVAVIPNEIVAFAELECVHHNIKVMLFRRSFNVGSSCYNIKDVVSVGDRLCMQARYVYIFASNKQWFAVHAWKDGAEVSLNEESDVGKKKSTSHGRQSAEESKNAVETAVNDLEISNQERINNTSVAVVSQAREDVDEYFDAEDEGGDAKLKTRKTLVGAEGSYSKEQPFHAKTGKPNEILDKCKPTSYVDDRFDTKSTAYICSKTSIMKRTGVKFDETSDILMSDPPLWGHISLKSGSTASIGYDGLKIFVQYKDIYIHGEQCTPSQFVMLLTTKIQQVNFEAVRADSTVTMLGYTHKATCAWVGEKPRPSVRASDMTILLSSNPAVKPRKAKSGKHSQTENKNTALAVHFNETSDILFNDPPLWGVLLPISNSTSSNRLGEYECDMCIAFEGLKIYVNCEIFYEGKLYKQLKGFMLGSIVHFEAVKTSDPVTTEGFSHVATCVWTGQKPSLAAIADTLPPAEFSLLEEKNRTYVGVVRKICLPKVALVVVEQHNTTVCLHVSAFDRKPVKHPAYYATGKIGITTFLKLNDKVEFKVARFPAVPKLLCCINVKILTGEKKNATSFENSSESAPQPEKTRSSGRADVDKCCRVVHWDRGFWERREEREAMSIEGISVSHSAPEKSAAQHKTRSCGPKEDASFSEVTPVSPSFSDISTSLRKDNPASKNFTNEEQGEEKSNNILYDSPEYVFPPYEEVRGVVYRLAPLKRLESAVVQKWYLNCSGVININTNKNEVAILPYNFVIDYADSKNTALQALEDDDDDPPNEERLLELNGKNVRFDAVNEGGGRTCLKLVWETPKPRPAYFRFLESRLKLNNFPSLPSQCRGVIVSIRSHDSAIAELVNGVPVLITIESLVTVENINPTSCSIDAYLSEGDFVSVEVKMSRTVSGIGHFFMAKQCWKVIKLKDSDAGDQVKNTAWRKKSWSNTWEFGEYFRKEKLKRENDNYVVTFHSSKLKSDFTLVIPQKCFFINSVLTDPSDEYRGRHEEIFDKKDITFHVAHKNYDSPSTSLYIPCAWIGQTPKPPIVFMPRFAVPKGVVSHNSYYEGIIEDFPLPTRAICRIGAVPVSVSLGEVNTETQQLLKRVEVDLVEGTRVWMRVLQLNYGDLYYVEANEICKMKHHSDVVTNFSGTVFRLPQPVGKIKTSSLENIEATFELANVYIPEGLSLTKDGVFEWFEYLNNIIKVGTPVYFTAVKTKQTGCYRALQVWVEGTSTFSTTSGKVSDSLYGTCS